MNLYYSLSRLRHKLFLKNLEILNKYGKIPPPHVVVWEATKQCNLACIHCGSLGDGQDLSTKEIKDAIDQLAVLGVKHFQITGGEPLVRYDLVEVLGYARQQGLITSLASNGYSLNDHTAAALSHAGVSSIQISIDGPKKVHNTIRQNDESFDRAIEAIRSLKRNRNAKVVVATTVMPQNMGSLGALKDILVSLQVDLWNMGTVMPVRNALKDTGLFLSKSQFTALMAFIIEAKKDLPVDMGENFPISGIL